MCRHSGTLSCMNYFEKLWCWTLLSRDWSPPNVLLQWYDRYRWYLLVDGTLSCMNDFYCPWPGWEFEEEKKHWTLFSKDWSLSTLLQGHVSYGWLHIDRHCHAWMISIAHGWKLLPFDFTQYRHLMLYSRICYLNIDDGEIVPFSTGWISPFTKTQTAMKC